MPLTQGNMQSVIAQSQREPGMIAGLGVQQADTPSPMNAPAPPNIAGASAKSSGGGIPSVPQSAPTGIPVSAPLPHAPFPAPSAQAPSMAPQGADPASAPISLNSLAPGANAASLPHAPFPAPGQAPAPSQSIGDAPGQGIAATIAGLGAGTGLAALIHRLSGSSPPKPAAVATPSAVTPASVASAVNSETPVAPPAEVKTTPEVSAQPARKMSPAVGDKAPANSPVAAAIEKSVPSEPQAASGPKPLPADVNRPAYERRPTPGPQQGPVTAPPRNSNPYPVDDGMSIPKVRPSPEIPASLQQQTNEQQFAKGVKPVGPPQSPVAAAIEKAVPSEPAPMRGPTPTIPQQPSGRAVPEFLDRQRNSPEEIRGVKPVGPEVQGPPMGPPPVHGTPGPMHGPPTDPLHEVTATSIIENLLHPKLSVEAPRIGNTVPLRAFRGFRMP